MTAPATPMRECPNAPAMIPAMGQTVFLGILSMQ